MFEFLRKENDRLDAINLHIAAFTARENSKGNAIGLIEKTAANADLKSVDKQTGKISFPIIRIMPDGTAEIGI